MIRTHDAWKRRTSSSSASSEPETAGIFLDDSAAVQNAAKGIIDDTDIRRMLELYLRTERFLKVPEGTLGKNSKFTEVLHDKTKEKPQHLRKICRTIPYGVVVGHHSPYFLALVSSEWPSVWKIEL